MRNKLFIGASVLAVACGAAQIAWAQSGAPAATPSASQLEEVVVTARRREERLQDVPVAVTAVTAAQLARANVQTLSDVQRLVPSLTMTLSNARAGSAAITLRGQRQSDLTITFDPSVGIYNNEVYVPRGQGVDTAAYDLESVQALKGPQGTLFGRNTTGGATTPSTAHHAWSVSRSTCRSARSKRGGQRGGGRRPTAVSDRARCRGAALMRRLARARGAAALRTLRRRLAASRHGARRLLCPTGHIFRSLASSTAADGAESAEPAVGRRGRPGLARRSIHIYAPKEAHETRPAQRL